MAEERLDARDLSWRQLLPWTDLFRGFQVALDPKKLLLAAAGLLVMASLSWLWSVVFYETREVPSWDSGKYGNKDSPESWRLFREDRAKWNLLHKAAGKEPAWTDANDLAERPEEYEPIKAALDKVPKTTKDAIAQGLAPPQGLTVDYVADGKPVSRTVVVHGKPYGRLRTMPWYEDRGPNPYLLVTGETQGLRTDVTGHLPWARGQFWDWLLGRQFPVLVEPVVKFLRPVVYLLEPDVGFWNAVYLVLVLLSILATWALFGGAITRMAVVQVARKEKIGIGEAVRFTLARYLSFFSAPIFPLLGVLVFVICLIIFGAFHLIPLVGDIVVDGLGWPLVLLAGLLMAVLLVGLVGWPMMYATISAEGSDSFDALSRSYSYVLQSPWHYIWYCLVAVAYGAAVVFFVGFMGSLIVYLGKWGIDQTPFISHTQRQPEYLFTWAPTSFGWHDLLMRGAPPPSDTYWTDFKWYNWAGVALVSFWLYLFFLLVVGFAYSYFWSASSIIYLLMRRKVDDTDVDEVYLEEDETEEPYAPPPAAEPAAAPAPAGGSLTMVEAPALRTATPAPAATAAPAPPPPATPARVEAAPAEPGDGNPPAAGTPPPAP